jgi:hypothetical protein
MENLNGYVAPEVRVIEVEVEKGFAVSQQEGSEWDDM